MDEDPKIEELADRWEAFHREGQSISPEDLCRDCLELLDALKEEIEDRKFAANFEVFAGVDPQQSAGVFSPFRVQSAPQHSVGDKFGQYKLEKFVGAGGGGEVWQASDLDLDRSVAIKILTPGEHSPEGDRKVAKLSYPGILPVLHSGKHDKWVYYIFELIDLDLAKLLRPRKPLPFTVAVRIAASVADALNYTHSQGLIHRDVKPGNILLNRDGHVYLTDFGIAIEADQPIDPRDAWLGTRAYMSPEQMRGDCDHLDRRTDVYSLGCVLYEMLTGERPVRGDAQARQTKLIACMPKFSFPFLFTIMIVRKCLEEDPCQRYASAKDLAKALWEYYPGNPPEYSSSRGRKRSPEPATGVAILIGAVGIAFTLLRKYFLWF